MGLRAGRPRSQGTGDARGPRGNLEVIWGFFFLYSANWEV